MGAQSNIVEKVTHTLIQCRCWMESIISRREGGKYKREKMRRKEGRHLYLRNFMNHLYFLLVDEENPHIPTLGIRS